MENSLTFKDYKKIFVCLTLYITSLFAANTLGLKIMPFFFNSHITVAIFTFPIVFIMTDVIGEVYGKKIARQFVFAGLISTILFIIYNIISVSLPWSSSGEWAHTSYNQIFAVSLRMSIASILAFAIGEYQDVFTFFFFKKKFGKFFWLRSTASNIWSQFLDSAIFMLVAFWGIYSLPTFISITLTLWVFKVLFGVLYLPLSYLGIYLLRGKINNGYENKSL